MQCAIYKSRRKQDTYLYLATKDDFSHIPDPLLKLIGELVDLQLGGVAKHGGSFGVQGWLSQPSAARKLW